MPDLPRPRSHLPWLGWTLLLLGLHLLRFEVGSANPEAHPSSAEGWAELPPRSIALVASLAFAMLLFRLQRKLTCGDPVHGLIGVASWCAFPVLLLAPMEGELADLANAFALVTSALAAGRGRWMLAGAASAIAVMAGGAGLLLPIALAVTASLHGRPRRRSLGFAVAGMAASGIPCLFLLLARDLVGPFAARTAQDLRGLASLLSGELPPLAFPEATTLSPHIGAPAALIVGGAIGLALLAIGAFTERRKALGATLLLLTLGLGGYAGAESLAAPDSAGLALALAIGLGHLGARGHEALGRRWPRGSRISIVGDIVTVALCFAVLWTPEEPVHLGLREIMPGSASEKVERGE